MTTYEFNKKMEILNKLKKEAFGMADRGAEEKEFLTFWKEWVAKTDYEFGQLAEIVYMFILGVLSYNTTHFRCSCSMREDKNKIDFRVNGNPIQVKTGWKKLPKDADEIRRAGIHLILCQPEDSGATILWKLAVPFAISKAMLDELIADYHPAIDIVEFVWQDFIDKSS